jgi:hypothetical protein
MGGYPYLHMTGSTRGVTCDVRADTFVLDGNSRI